MKCFILLICTLAATFAQAQIAPFRSATIKQFGKSVQKSAGSDAAFREKLSVLLPDYAAKLDRADSDSSAFDALVDATFLIQSDPALHAAWLSDIGMPKAAAAQLADYALYRFTNRAKPDPRLPAGFRFGLRLFRPEGAKPGYHLVRLERDGKIAITAYDSYGQKGFTATGTLKGNRVIADEAKFADQFFFLEGVLGIAAIDHIGVAYHPCDRYGNFLQEPAPVFEDITATDMLRQAGVPEAEIIAAISAKNARLPFNISEETPPSFKGGEEALIDYLRRSLRYPPEAAKKGIWGTVLVDFTVTTEGKIRDVEVKTKHGHGLDAEAIRVVSRMPDWVPGKINGAPSNSRVQIPVTFSIEHVIVTE